MTILDRILGRNTDKPTKAVAGGVWLSSLQNGPQLEAYGNSWQERATAFLGAYKVDWFYKGGSRIAADFASLEWKLAYEDSEGDNEDDIVAAPGNVPWERLDPLEQFLRLCEKPNPWQTGIAFRAQQQVRLDFTGRAIIYIEDGDGSGLPTAWYGISPDRMWQSRNTKGELVGWVMDKNAPSGGVPFDVETIISVETPGTGTDPQGVVEAVYPYVKLQPMVPHHTADVLSTGGRLAGMAWPKERSLSEDEFLDAQRAWRNVTSDPNAARRLLLFPEPMEYQAGAATPDQIGLPELAALSRDEVLTAFPIAPEMLMVPMASGLNSGQTQVVVEKRYWSGTMHPRVEVWEETLQQALIPLYEKAVGRPLDFDIEEPDLDDAVALVGKADALDKLIALGFEEKAAVAAVGLDHIKFVGKPEPPPMPEIVPPQPGEQPDQPAQPVPPAAPAAKGAKARRESIVGETLPGFESIMRTFLEDQRLRLMEEITRHLGKTQKADRMKANPTWWDQEQEDALLREALRPIYLRLARAALRNVADEVDRFIYSDRANAVSDRVLAKVGVRITEMNGWTFEKVNGVVSEGIRRGYSAEQITRGWTAEGFRGVADDDAFAAYRAERIARTETMFAYNQSNLEGYREFGIEQFEAIDGDLDDECAARDGQIVDGEQMQEWVDAEHPNGTLDFAPIFPDKAQHVDTGHLERMEMMATIKAVAELQREAPVVNITNLPPGVQVDAPITVEQAAPTVTVEGPVINLPEQEAPVVNITNIPPAVTIEPASIVVTTPDVHMDAPVVNVTLPEQKPTRRTIERDERGQIVGITDGE